MTEKEKLKLLTENMYCEKYNVECLEVPYEVIHEGILELTGLGFSNYDCDLLCKNCKYMKEI